MFAAGSLLARLASIAVLIGALGFVTASQVMVVIPGDPIRIDAGLVSGTIGPDGVKTYFGIPFAAPPIRENRWRPPQSVTPWKGILTADRKPAECVQGLRSPTINHYFGDDWPEKTVFISMFGRQPIRNLRTGALCSYGFTGALSQEGRPRCRFIRAASLRKRA
jgi:hypothetical protein